MKKLKTIVLALVAIAIILVPSPALAEGEAQAVNEWLGGAFNTFAGAMLFFGMVSLSLGFMGNDDAGFHFDRGWNSRKQQGLILLFSAGILNSLGADGGSIFSAITPADCTVPGFTWIGKGAKEIGGIVMMYGMGQFALNIAMPDIGSRLWGIRLIVAGAAITQIGGIANLILPGLGIS
ncbi:MAG: hypothetical protein LBM38_01140 [Clostridiales bacterium]|jgi:hypothetical protein|nr:hypothetical protein [Clostridiales bacterium]